jgi:Uma2 family endonuclease
MSVTMTALPKRYFTPEEYLELELKAEYKSQYVGGEIFAMAGAQPWHIEVMGNIAGLLYNQFRGRPCKAYFAEMRVRVNVGDLWTYPDVAALCGEPKFEAASNPHSLLNPQVIFEVLSPSTEAFDRGDKFARYRLLDSLTDYVLVSSERMRVEHYVRQDDDCWMFKEYQQPDTRLPLASVGCELPLADIYERVTFPAPGARG